MPTTPSRFYVRMSNDSLSFRVQAHREDATLLVLKAIHPEAVDTFVQLAGDVGVKETFKGSAYFITFVDRAKFCAAVGKFCLGICEPVPETKVGLVLVPPAIAAYDNAEDGTL